MREHLASEQDHFSRLATIAQLLLDHSTAQAGLEHLRLADITPEHRARLLRVAERALSSINPNVMLKAADEARREVETWMVHNPSATPSQIANEAIHRYEALVTA